MKRKVLCFALACVFAVSLAACNADTGQAGADSAGDVNRVIIARPVDSDNLDPVTSVGNTNIWIYKLMLDSLVDITEDGREIVPNLAESFTVSDDNLVYTFTLKPGVRFSDGTYVTVDDWVFSFERAMSDLANHWAFASDNIERVEALDENTFAVVLHNPSPATLANLSMFSLGVQSRAFYMSLGETYEERDERYVNGFVGTGPFMLGDWQRGQQLTLVRNPYYRTGGLPLADEIIFRVVPDDAARAMQLEAGEVDIMTFVPFSTLREFGGRDGFRAYSIQGTETRFVSFSTLNEYLSDIRVRTAINLATNNQEIVDMAMFGYGERAISFLQGSSPFINPNLPNPPITDIERARELMAEAGHADGITLNMVISAGNLFQEQVATILMEQWSQIGVTLLIEPEEPGNYWDRIFSFEFDTVFNGWTDDVPDPIQFLDAVCYFDLYATFDTNYRNPRVEELNRLQAVEMDPARRLAYIHEIQQLLHDAQIFVPIAYIPFAVIVNDRIEGFVQTPLGHYRFERIQRVR